MAKFALVEQGNIISTVDQLPSSWRNVSGLDLSANDLPLLASLGWFPVIATHVAWDPNYEYISGYTYELQGDVVYESLEITPNPPAPVYPPEFLHDVFMTQLRTERNQTLTASDWSQTVDLQAVKSEQWRDAWRTYRQTLRDLPAQYDQIDQINIADVIWPEPPQIQG